jgi:UDPglucose 6-dehydrogenase
MRIAVIGTGYVGTVTGACLAYAGHRVSCVDTDASKIACLQRGESPVYEPHLAELLRTLTARRLIDFTTNIAEPVLESDAVFIAVGTPPQPDGQPNLESLEAAARSIGACLSASQYTVVSTSPLFR